MELFSTKILGTGKYHPSKILTNDDLSKMVDTNDEWIVQRTGIKERRIGDLAKEEYPSGMSKHAALMAIENAGLTPNDIEMIIFSTTLPDMLFPNTASCLQEKLGITNKCACMDINAACTGWIYGITVANSLIQTGVYKNILVVGCEMTSSFNNWEDRSTCVLFGDGSGATVLGRAPKGEGSTFLSSILSSDSSKKDSLMLPNGGSKSPITKEILDRKEQYVVMDGQTVFKNAVKTMASHCSELLTRHNLTLEDIDWFIPHQANLRIVEAVAHILKFPMEKTIINIEKYANTSSASIPVALHEAFMDGRIKRGQTIMFAAFGAGLTAGATIIKF